MQIDEYDAATILRRQEIFDKINRRRKNKKAIGAGRQCDYKSVVNEVQFADDFDVFSAIFSFFKTGRKLKPLVQKRQIKALESIQETKLMVHIIRGADVPIRVDYFNAYAKEKMDQGNKDLQALYSAVLKKDQVMPFVEVRVVDPEAKDEKDRERVMRTETGDG